MYRGLFVLLLFLPVPLLAKVAGAWHVDAKNTRVFSQPSPIWDAGSSGVYVSCVRGTPSVLIRVRDPVPSMTDVRIQYDGHQGGIGSFVGKDGLIRNYKFARGTAAATALANPPDSLEIIHELLRGHSRLGYIVDTTEGFDSLEVRVGGFAAAWKALRCPGFETFNPASKPAAPLGTLKVSSLTRYPATTQHDAFNERDTFYVPLSNTCGTRFRVDQMTENTDFSDRERLNRSFDGPRDVSDIRLTVTKRFAGRGAQPTLVIVADNERAELSFTSAIDLRAWPEKGYKIRATFSPRNLPIAKFWTRVELRCTE